MNKLRDIGKYRLITNGDFDLCEADVFLLDSLVLIDIRNFYFDGLNPNSASGLHQLLVTMSPNKQVRPDVVFGFCFSRDLFSARGVRPFTLSAYLPCGTNSCELESGED